jgi:surface polysaccharide O-acyltransferase-like enzyme
VGLFIFLSGMLSNASNWKPWKRIKKVLIPYLIWTAVYVAINNYKTPLSIPIDYIRGLLTGQSSAIMYYIFVYIQFTLLIPLVDRIAKSKLKYLGFVISPLEIIIMRLIPLVIGVKMNEYIQIVLSVSCLGWFSYFYLGYLLGNGLLQISITKKKLQMIFFLAFILQILEGFWYFSMGDKNCGTQLKLSSILTGCFFSILAYQYIESEQCKECKLLYLLGDCSFGIYFSHLAIMSILSKIHYYREFVIFPINAVVALSISLVLVLISRRLFGKYSKYLAF